MQICLLICRFAVYTAAAFLCCAPSTDDDSSFDFSVLDVGQGLSQIGVMDGRSVVWDMGPGASHERWEDGYRANGSPFVETIIISHTDEDHLGGLEYLDSNAAFTGLVTVSHFSDTAFIRDNAGAWQERLRFRLICDGDTVACFPGVSMTCLWPPADSLPEGSPSGDERNRFSLVFHISLGSTSVLVTSDVDSFALQALARSVRWSLASDIVIAPHHGSAGSVCPVFYGYACPAVVVISCAEYNNYGHPSPQLLDLLFQTGISVVTTWSSGHFSACSNRFYFRW